MIVSSCIVDKSLDVSDKLLIDDLEIVWHHLIDNPLGRDVTDMVKKGNIISSLRVLLK